PIIDVVYIGGDDGPGAAGFTSHLRTGGRVVGIQMQYPPAFGESDRGLPFAVSQAFIAIPEDGPFARARIDDDEGDLRACPFDDLDEIRVDAFIDERLQPFAPLFVRSEAPRVGRAQPQAAQPDHGR